MKYLSCLLLTAVLMTACGKNDGGGTTPTPTNSLGKSSLLFPSQNSACTTGTNQTATQSTVAFSWAPAANANSYELDIKNLTTGVITTQSTIANQINVPLVLNTAYSWYVIAKSTQSTTTQSDTWKFYNSGPGATFYAPFLADQLTPANNQAVTATTGKINLTWVGADPDNDIANYAVYFGTNASGPPLLKSGVTDMFLNGVTVSSGTTYYWYVLTTDRQGFTSTSNISKFTVN